MLLNYNKGLSRIAIDDYDSLRQDAMNRLIHKALGLRFEIPSRDFGMLRGALHLILFDTSPLQVHTQQTLSLRRLLAQILEIAVYRLLGKPGVCVADRRLRRDTGVFRWVNVRPNIHTRSVFV
jgi:hypothetical protein